MKTTIFYFSATGNSLYVAKKLAGLMGEATIHSMANYEPNGQTGGKDDAVGFVFPSYYGKMPRLVSKFVGELDINPDTWVFCLSTMGIPLGTGSLKDCQQVLGTKGLTLQYGRGITMPRNYIVKYNPLTAEAAMKYNKRADEKLVQVANEIKAKKAGIHLGLVSWGLYLSTDTLYKNIESLDDKFFVENRCNSCGLCEKVCPVQNVKLVDGKPQWQHHCEHCVACIQLCSQETIQYGTKTKARRRYHNPEINVTELIR
ncbi:MAG: EFR1 family ferrodoxin [Defluviitaleaceae bacterium]|nr:EFR1 family ferrodoxin [Defluviitaleaceae bacterium]